MHPLATVPGTVGSKGNAINDGGQIAGTRTVDASGTPRAFRWSPATPNGTTGSMLDLGFLPNTQPRSQAHGLNNDGVVVGESGSGVDDARAFIWTAADGMQDLHSLLDQSGADWRLLAATAINDAGQIVGSGQHTGAHRAFLLTPIPEPAGPTVTIGVGSLVLASTARSRRRLSA
jgi:probable HAF family extracellular repeat protein